MEKLHKLLECPVCYDKLSPPVTSCVNGHVVCDKCRKSLQNCPTCRDKFTTLQQTFLNQLLEAIPVNCKNAANGCLKLIPIIEMRDHEKNCDFATVRCFLCSANLTYCNLQLHLATTFFHFARTIKLGEELECKGEAFQKDQGIICIENNIKIMFYLKCVVQHEKGNIIFCVQYLGPKENIKKYLYQVRFLQGQNMFFTFAGFCLPYFDSDSDMVEHPDILPLKIDKIFLDKKIPSDFKIYYKITKAIE